MNQAISTPLRGTLLRYYETGYEGSQWAFVDGQLPGLAGLNILESGDSLKIFSKDGSAEIVWNGTLELTIPLKNRFGGVVATHGQVGVDLDLWAKWFNEEYPAELSTKK